ncbi:AAA family ATPase [Variovorax dokdonensis]|uniref:AAA family ATPase n=1 Tax=Variovorax dokdonensis TaxID=344883 RepID=A0ABT7N9D0_9BURK|nr:AAA family ATPase [Variovorax dokdonensis]MDM0044542.1 AAA family ATPase [Variovorax dokdonensis]
MLIVLGGLPGTGKTTIARKLVARLPAAYLRIDTIEQALMKAGELDEAGASRLRFGLRAGEIQPCARNHCHRRLRQSASGHPKAWRDVASSASKELLEVEVVCSDAAEHRRRVESRKAEIPEGRLPNWDEVLRREYETWTSQRLVIDSALIPASEAANLIFESSRVRPLAA